MSQFIAINKQRRINSEFPLQKLLHEMAYLFSRSFSSDRILLASAWFPTSTMSWCPEPSPEPNLWLKLPEDNWSQIIPFISAEDTTNLAEVFPKMTGLIRTIVIANSNQSDGPTAKRLKLLERCPKVNVRVVRELSFRKLDNFRFMEKIAEINQNLKSIRFGDRFQLEHPEHDSRLRIVYIERIWKMKGTVDTFKSPVQFHSTLDPKYDSFTAEVNKRIEFKPGFDYDNIENWKLIHVTEISVSEDSHMLHNLITRCPNLRLLQMKMLFEAWTTLPHNPALKWVIGGTWRGNTMINRDIESFLDVISKNTGNLEEIHFYRRQEGIEFFHIKKNVMTITTKYEVPLPNLIKSFPRIRTILVEKLREPAGGVTRILDQIQAINNGIDEPFTVVIDNPMLVKLCRRRVAV